MAAPAWNGWILGEVGASAQAQTDDEIEQYVRNTASTVYHPCGTAAMGKTGSTGSGTGVLNSDLTVKGTVGLRVVDASAFVSIFYFRPRTGFQCFFVYMHGLALYPSSSHASANICSCRACRRPNQTSMACTLRKARYSKVNFVGDLDSGILLFFLVCFNSFFNKLVSSCHFLTGSD